MAVIPNFSSNRGAFDVAYSSRIQEQKFKLGHYPREERKYFLGSPAEEEFPAGSIQ
jgi:hypothetical protein